MKGLFSKKVSILGKEVPLLVLAILAMSAALGSAALLSYYGIIKGTVNVTQSLQISQDGSNWKSCTGGNYDACTITYPVSTIVAGDNKTISNTFYIKNNLPVEGSWDYIYFKYRYEIPKDLFDGLQKLEVSLTTYPSGTTPEPACNHTTTIPLTTGWSCNTTTCTLEAPDQLGEGMIQKFCGVTIGLKSNTIPGEYEVRIEIVPA